MNEEIIYQNMTHTLGNGIEVRYEASQPETGWICPKCGKAVSPHYSTCPYCSTQLTDEGLKPGEQIIHG